MTGKQCRPWSDAEERNIWLRSTHYAQACLSNYVKCPILSNRTPSKTILDLSLYIVGMFSLWHNVNTPPPFPVGWVAGGGLCRVIEKTSTYQIGRRTIEKGRGHGCAAGRPGPPTPPPEARPLSRQKCDKHITVVDKQYMLIYPVS